MGFYFALCFRYGDGGRQKVGSEDEGLFRRRSRRSSSGDGYGVRSLLFPTAFFRSNLTSSPPSSWSKSFVSFFFFLLLRRMLTPIAAADDAPIRKSCSDFCTISSEFCVDLSYGNNKAAGTK